MNSNPYATTNLNAKFDLEKAKLGHPVRYINIYNGRPTTNLARIICYDFKDEANKKHLIAVITDKENNDVEYTTTFSNDGVDAKYSWLEMAPICTVEGKEIYPGDVVYVTNFDGKKVIPIKVLPITTAESLVDAKLEMYELETWQLMFLHKDSPDTPLIDIRKFKSEPDALNDWKNIFSTEYMSDSRFSHFMKTDCKLIRPVKTSF